VRGYSAASSFEDAEYAFKEIQATATFIAIIARSSPISPDSHFFYSVSINGKDLVHSSDRGSALETPRSFVNQFERLLFLKEL